MLPRVESWLRWLSEHEFALVLIIVVASLAMHFSTMADPSFLIGDESHYIKDAQSISDGFGLQRPEHPSLAKIFIVWGMKLFGNNPYGWRVFPVLFSTVSVLLVYAIARRFVSLKYAALVATFLFAFENMGFVQGSVAMLDVYFMTFMLLGFWLYLRGSYALAALAIAFSAVAKFSGAFGVIPIGLHWLITRRNERWGLVKLVLITPAAFIALIALTDYGLLGQWLNPIDRVFNESSGMLAQLGQLTFAAYKDTNATRPWVWLIKPSVFPYCFDPPYMAMLTITFWALIMPAMLYMLWPAIKGSQYSRFSLYWFIGSFGALIPMTLIDDRLTYAFYFYPAVPAVAMAIAFGLAYLLELGNVPQLGRVRWIPRALVWGYLLTHLIVFGVVGPVFH